jgi:hypothetical protein
VSEKVGLGQPSLPMGANFGDIDNDGYLDVYLGTGLPVYQALMPNLMYRNVGGERFEDVSFSWGFAHLQKGHGVAFGDIDNDGDQDVYIVMGGGLQGDVFRNALFLNPGNSNHWITLLLEGVKSNRAGIGARIKVTLETDVGSRDIYAVVSTGGSFGSSSLQQEIGLGQARAVRAIEVTWPASGIVQVFRDVGMDQFLKIREGDPAPVPVKRKKVPLAVAADPGLQAASHVHARPAGR